MSIERVFLDWRLHGLPAAADYLIGQFGAERTLDLSGLVVAVPGGRVERRLLEILVDRVQQQSLTLTPPSIVTVGKLPERLYTAQRPFADELTQQLAWIEALRSSTPQTLRQLIPSTPPEDDLPAWLALGTMLARLHRELAADGFKFEDVARHGSRLEEFPEQQRWLALAAVQQRYLEILDGLELWDRETARLYAIEHKECHIDGRIVLVGLADMNQSQRQMLDQVADQVAALVFAPDELAERFDEHGCLQPEKWLDAPIDLSTDRISITDAPTDQATAVVRALADFAGRYAAEQITVGVPDERIVPYVVQHLRQSGVTARHGAGVPVAQSAPYRLLEAVAGYLDGRSFAAMAALVRHAAVHAWLTAQRIDGDWITQMDRYYTEHLPRRVGRRATQPDQGADAMQEVCGQIEKLTEPLAEDRRPLSQWGEPILGVLAEVFGRPDLDRDAEEDRELLIACEKIRDVLAAHTAVPDELMPRVTGAEAMRLALQQTAGERIPPPADREAVELLGWLELPLDDAPALIVTGFNEGIVPGSVNADLFLPNQLRRALGIENNDRRFARDAYALSLLAASRQELTIIAGRRTADADPLTPSRLLFACDDMTAARRAKTFFSPPAESSQAVFLPPTGPMVREPTSGEPPRPRPLAEPVRSMRVTEFRDYLACPYRYYLRHQLKLRGLSDSQQELDAAAFGSLAHDVLSRFGQADVKDSVDTLVIADCFDASLDDLVRRKYGKEPLPAVRVQVEQLRRRLRALAEWQANWAAEGWRIEQVEIAPAKDTAAMLVDGEPMFLRGRIDRIDVHLPTGRRAILDYKTSDTAKRPDQTHRKKGQWVDLQLPLYRHLARGLGIEGSVELGYIVLPKDLAKVGHLAAEWDDAELDDADAVAQDVIRKVRAEEFWAPVSPPPAFSEEFAAICGDGQFGALLAADEQAEDGP